MAYLHFLEKEFIKENYLLFGPKIVANRLNRSTTSIISYAKELNLQLDRSKKLSALDCPEFKYDLNFYNLFNNSFTTNLASIYNGLVIDTDNLTENNLGYFTIHGDVGDFNPIGGLWKTEVFELAAWLVSDYYKQYTFNNPEKDTEVFAKIQAIMESLKLKPTAGLGITNNDLEEIGTESYEQVDSILQEILAWKNFKLSQGFEAYLSINCNVFLEEQQMLNIPYKIVENVAKRHFTSEFKRNELPLKIKRYELFR